MASAVEPVPAHAMLRRYLSVDRIHRCCGRDSAEKAGVKHRDVGDIGKQIASHLNAVNVRWIMQWCQRNQVPHHAQHLIGDDHRLGEQNTTMHHAVPHGRDVHVLQTATMLAHQCKRHI